MTADLLATAQRVWDESPKQNWYRRALGTAQLRAGRYREAIETLEASLQPATWWLGDSMTWPLLAMAHHQLGEHEQARKRLNQAEFAAQMHEQAAEAERYDSICAPHGIVPQNWLLATVFLHEVKALIDGPEAAANARKLLATRAEARRGDAGAKAALRKENALASEQAAWQHKVDAAGRDPLPWIERGRWHAQRGEHEKADADFTKAASLTPNELNKFLAAGWWVAGPYPPSLKEFCPPEIDPDPSKPVHVVDPQKGLSDQRVGWVTVATDAAGLVDARPLMSDPDNSSIYALVYVYSPDERTALLRITRAKGIRIWINGKLAFETEQQLGLSMLTERVPIALAPGRNQLLVKTLANTPFSLRLGDSPSDRTTMFAERHLWDEAATLFQNEPQHAIQASQTLWSEFIKIALLVGHEQFYRDQSVQIFEQHRRSGNMWERFHAAHAVSFAPNSILQEHYEEVVRLALSIANQRTDNSSRGHAGQARLTAAWAGLQSGRVSAAEGYLAELPELGYIQQMAFAGRAILAEKKGNHEEAMKWLEKSHSYVVQHCSMKRFPHWPHTVTILIQLREAERVVTGSTTRSDGLIAEVRAKDVAAWKAADPLTLAFDHRILTLQATSQRASEAEALLARGRRLLELQRWEAAEADFDNAIQLAAKDPKMLVERARFHASRGDAEKAAADFNHSLDLFPEKERWSLGQPTYLQIAAHDAVFDRLAALRPADRNLWVNRMIHHMRQGERQAALADAERLLTYGVNYIPMATVLLFGDTAEFERLRTKATDLPDSYFKPLALALAPTVEPMTADLLATAERVGKQTEGNTWDRRAQGLAQFRAGRWRETVDTLQPTLESSASWQHAAANWPVLAMAHHRLGEKEQARKRLQQAAVWLSLHEQALAARHYDTISTPQHGLIAQEWLLTFVLFKEAKALFDAASAEGAAP